VQMEAVLIEQEIVEQASDPAGFIVDGQDSSLIVEHEGADQRFHGSLAAARRLRSGLQDFPHERTSSR
jgi:hypothetical protein